MASCVLVCHEETVQNTHFTSCSIVATVIIVVLSHLIFDNTVLVLIQHGSVHRTVNDDIKLCGWLCSIKDMPHYDDDNAEFQSRPLRAVCV